MATSGGSPAFERARPILNDNVGLVVRLLADQAPDRVGTGVTIRRRRFPGWDVWPMLVDLLVEHRDCMTEYLEVIRHPASVWIGTSSGSDELMGVTMLKVINDLAAEGWEVVGYTNTSVLMERPALSPRQG